MKRFLLALRSEFTLARASIPVHVVAILQPTVMYLLMSSVLVHPTFDMYVTRPSTEAGYALVGAMEQVGSPIGVNYINPVLIDVTEPEGLRQVVSVEERNGVIIAVQRYGLIDSNMVKNFRNRVTAAALRLWNDELGDQAVTIEEHPWLPEDMPYTIYFGMAMLPLTVAVAASIIGGILTAQEFEYDTILEYRLAPVSVTLVIGVRLVRLIIVGLISALILLVALRYVNGVWPDSFWRVGLILIPVGIIYGSLGISAGLLLRKSIPAFLVGLVTSFVGWLLGSAFGLAAGFSGAYAALSHLTPNTHATELLFPFYFGADVGSPSQSILFLVLLSVVMVVATMLIYHLRVLKQV
jgi:ABC-type multidrug transport system permease subunit